MQTVALPAEPSLRLSRVGLGCWTLSGRYWGPDQDDARAIRTIHAALEAGINWVDTAPLYGDGHGDALVKQALAGRSGVIVATKVGVRRDGPHAHSDLRAEHLRADAEDSLRRLGRETLDLLQVHWPCERGTPLDETVGALEGLRDRGLIRAWGLCNYDAAGVLAASAVGRPATLQTPLSLLRREAEATLLPAAAGLEPPPAVLAYETLARGILSGRWQRPPELGGDDLRQRDPRYRGAPFWAARDLLDELAQVAAKVGATVPALSVGWALQRPGVSAVIVGARSPAQITETAAAVQLLGRPRLWRVVDAIAAAHGGPPRPA